MPRACYLANKSAGEYILMFNYSQKDSKIHTENKITLYGKG